MKKLSVILVIFSMLLVSAGCTSKEVLNRKIVFPEDITVFVQKKEFEKIDWKRKAVKQCKNLAAIKRWLLFIEQIQNIIIRIQE